MISSRGKRPKKEGESVNLSLDDLFVLSDKELDDLAQRVEAERLDRQNKQLDLEIVISEELKEASRRILDRMGRRQ